MELKELEDKDLIVQRITLLINYLVVVFFKGIMQKTHCNTSPTPITYKCTRLGTNINLYGTLLKNSMKYKLQSLH